MATIKFYTDNRMEGEYTVLYGKIFHDGKSKKVYPGIKLRRELWDAKKQTIKGSNIEVIRARSKVDSIKRLVEITIPEEYYEEHGLMPGFDELIHEYEQRGKFYETTFNEPMKRSIVFSELVDDYCFQNQNTLAESTLSTYRQLYNQMVEYEKKHGKITRTKAIRDETWLHFVNYLIEEKQLANTSISQNIALIRTIFNNNEKVFDGYKLKKRKVMKIKVRQPEKICLTEDELRLIINYDASHNPELQSVKDIFLFACFTGMRISEISDGFEVKEDHILVHQTKTKYWKRIPINNIVQEILERNNNELTAPVSTGYLRLRELLVATGGFQEVEKVIWYSGNKEITKETPRYKRITWHTARHTAFNFWIDNGMDIKEASLLLGHKNLSTTLEWYHHKNMRVIKQDKLKIDFDATKKAS